MDELGAYELTAVDILLSPDESMLALAERVNARMLTSVPSPPGFGLDQHHQPHITALQRYVRTADLDNVYVAIEGILASLDLSTLTLTAHGLAHMEVQPSVGLRWPLFAAAVIWCCSQVSPPSCETPTNSGAGAAFPFS